MQCSNSEPAMKDHTITLRNNVLKKATRQTQAHIPIYETGGQRYVKQMIGSRVGQSSQG